MKILFAAFAAIVISCPCYGQSSELLDAIKQVESGGRDIDGDGGAAIGPYQIHRAYWQDAVRINPSIGGSYSDCHGEAYARIVVKTYLGHYGRGKSTESMARIHNGGPKGHLRSATIKYWTKIEKELNRG